MRRAVVLSLVLLGCVAKAPEVDPPVDAGVDAGLDARVDAGVLQFTQATGCLNDGCVSPGDAALIASIQANAPSAHPATTGGVGKASCDRATETYDVYPRRPQTPRSA